MVPRIGRQRVFGGHPDRVAGIEVNECRTRFSIKKKEFVAPASSIGPGLGPAPDDRALKFFRSINPHADREGLGPAKGSGSLNMNCVVSGQLQPLAVNAFHRLVIATCFGGLVLTSTVRKISSLAAIEGDMGFKSRPLKLRGTIC